MKFKNLSVKRLFGRMALGLVLSMSGITDVYKRQPIKFLYIPSVHFILEIPFYNRSIFLVEELFNFPNNDFATGIPFPVSYTHLIIAIYPHNPDGIWLF